MNTRFVLMLLIAICFLSVAGCSNESGKETLFKSFQEKLAAKDFEGLYLLLSEESKKYISEKEFVERYTNIYGSMQAEDLNIEKDENESEGNTILFSMQMTTIAGQLELDYQLPFVKDGNEWKIQWDESLIFPNMKRGDKVRISNDTAKRGSILDRNGISLAKDGLISTVGIHPEVFDKSKRDEKIQEIAAILDINENIIIDKLNENTNPDYYVPIVDILSDDERLKQLEERWAEGIFITTKDSRIYINDEAFGRLLGNIGTITTEELDEHKGEGYNSSSFIGKAGLKQVYEDILRGIDGVEIYIERDGEKVDSIVKKEPKNGQDIQLTIDAKLQSNIYEEMNGEKGSASAVNPATGEILALVSSPSYNANRYTTYVTKTEQQEREKTNFADEENRFTKLYSPGSVFKLITAAAGLENGTIDPAKEITINGSSWQKDSSWGNYSVTRVNNQTSVDLKSAIQYSDNIYFAISALEMGGENFIIGAKKFGIGEEIEVGYPFPNSQISNDGTFRNDILLADSGYGQGEIMVTSLNMALAYSALSNDGNIMSPFLVISDNQEAKVWKEAVISSENLPILQQAFAAVIEGDGGTAAALKIPGVSLAGKTGTAEIKASQSDESGTENGWLVATDLDSSRVSLAIVLEDAKEGGGSKAVVPIAKNVLATYLKS